MRNRGIPKAAAIALVAGVTAFWCLRHRQRFAPTPEPVVPPVEPAAAGLAQRFQAIEVQQNQLDQTVWSTETVAEKHEAVFIKLWDDLRTQADPFSVLDQFPFGELRLPTAGDPMSIEHGIVVRHLTGPRQRLTPELWRRLLADWKQRGIALEQSEWRQAQFAAPTNAPAQSVIALTLHARDAKRNERFIVRGNLAVTWGAAKADFKSLPPSALAQPASTPPFLQIIEATDLEVLSRAGEPPFHHVLAADLAPEQWDARFLDPGLKLYDLDGDGLSEIIVAGRNRVYWNQGNRSFKQAPLLAHPLPGLHTSIIADFDGDGVADFLAADAHGLVLFKGDHSGHFPTPGKRVWSAEHELLHPVVMTAGDIDGDGDLDVWLAQYKPPYLGGQMPTPYYDANDGYPSYLLVNNGDRAFQDRTEAAGLGAKRFRRTYSCSFIDLEGDGDLDLVVVSDFAGTDIHLNDGHGHFTDATPALLDETHAFGMSHRFGDFNLDGKLDLLVIGMNSFAAQRLDGSNLGPPGFESWRMMRPKMSYGNRLYLGTGSTFKQTALGDALARTGWSWGVTTGDFDNDGDEDIYLVNGHVSGRSAKDYESRFWCHDIYLGTSKEDPALDAYFRGMQARHQRGGGSYGGFEKKRFFLNQSGQTFLEIGYLMGLAMETDCRYVVSDDLAGSGRLDLVVVTFETLPSMREELHLFANLMPDSGNWIGVHLREGGPGFSAVGAKVFLTTPTSKQARYLVTGDSYRTQHANTAHFGLGAETNVRSLEVVWPNGHRREALHPAINRYHLVEPEQPRPLQPAH